MKTIVHAIDEMKMGGAQTHLLTIIKEIKRQHPEDVHVLVVLFDDTQFKKELKELAIEPILLDLRPLFKKRQFLKAYKKIKDLLQSLEPQVVETHLTWSRLLVNTAAYQLKIARRIGFEHGDIYMNSTKMRLANYGTQFFFHKIIVCSDTLKKWVMQTHKIKEKKIKVLYNCVDLQKFAPVKKKDLKTYLELESASPRYTFISVGTMGKGVNKRMDISIKAVAKLQKQNIDAGLVLCGDGEQRAELEQLSRNEGVEKQIYFLGNREDVDKILPHCYAYVHSAAYEPFGIVKLWQAGFQLFYRIVEEFNILLKIKKKVEFIKVWM